MVLSDRHHDAAVTSVIPALSCPIMPAERVVCSTGAAIADQHHRRNARGAQAESAWRMIAIDQGGGKRRGCQCSP